MQFIGYNKPLLKRREAVSIRLLPTLIVFVGFVVVTVVSWSTAKTDNNTLLAGLLQQNSTEVVTIVQKQLDAYENIIRGAAGLFDSKTSVSRYDWKRYLSTYELSTRYPGIQAVAFSKVISADELDSTTQSVRDQGYVDFEVFPRGARPLYTTILYLEPFEGTNVKAFGYDMYTEPIRHAAMDRARDTGQMSLSSLLTLVQENNTPNKQPGFIMYFPVYLGTPKPQNATERTSSLIGFTCIPIRTHDFISSIYSRKDKYYGFKVIDSSSVGNQVLFQTENFDNLSGGKGVQKFEQSITTRGVNWKIVSVSWPQIVSPDIRSRPAVILWIGLTLSFFIAGFVYLLLSKRVRVIAKKEEQIIQQAKDDLLALASHQLRTPATGVKQYIGMLKEGLAGELTAKQLHLVTRAFESNDRQLSIINEMLFVARTDAGHLKIEKERINMSALIKDIVDELKPKILERSQRIRLQLPKEAVLLEGDKQYLRMALENILNNATNYTNNGGLIRVKLIDDESEVQIKFIDNGVGVKLSDQSLLFKKFSRIPNELTNKVSGSGIGLYLVKKIIDLHGGNVLFESVPEKGSTVTISLPKNEQEPIR